jgi:hypothetical protein
MNGNKSITLLEVFIRIPHDRKQQMCAAGTKSFVLRKIVLIIPLLPKEVQGLTNAVTEGVNDANLVVVLSQKTKLIVV